MGFGHRTWLAMFTPLVQMSLPRVGLCPPCRISLANQCARFPRYFKR